MLYTYWSCHYRFMAKARGISSLQSILSLSMVHFLVLDEVSLAESTEAVVAKPLGGLMIMRDDIRIEWDLMGFNRV